MEAPTRPLLTPAILSKAAYTEAASKLDFYVIKTLSFRTIVSRSFL